MSPVQQEVAPVVPFEARFDSVAVPDVAPEVTIKVDEVFNGATAWELRKTLETAPRAQTVVLDFSRVREFYDFGVGVLAHWLAQRANTFPRVLLRGLRTHQLRMFRYFGVDTES
jgi:anti-anti-sigma regulatory factor